MACAITLGGEGSDQIKCRIRRSILFIIELLYALAVKVELHIML